MSLSCLFLVFVFPISYSQQPYLFRIHLLYSLGSTFIYIEASRPAMKDDNAWLASPVIPTVSTTDPKCFQFQYFMYGAAMGSLNILIYKDGSFKKVWSLSGNQGEVWRTGVVPLPTGVNQRVYIVFHIVTQSSKTDLANKKCRE